MISHEERLTLTSCQTNVYPCAHTVNSKQTESNKHKSPKCHIRCFYNLKKIAIKMKLISMRLWCQHFRIRKSKYVFPDPLMFSSNRFVIHLQRQKKNNFYTDSSRNTSDIWLHFEEFVTICLCTACSHQSRYHFKLKASYSDLLSEVCQIKYWTGQ